MFSVRSAAAALLLGFLLVGTGGALTDRPLDVRPRTVDVVVGGEETVEFFYKNELHEYLEIELASSDSSELSITPTAVSLTPQNRSATVRLRGVAVTSRVLVKVKSCAVLVSATRTNCSFQTISVFAEVKVVKSGFLSALVVLAGWIYFAAWSISFYPQIILNYQRKSVVGLNFDFLVLNIIGFACYTVYNVMLYFNKNVQEIYIEKNILALIPVLFNDVVFSTHALIACIVTGLQCFIYERDAQRISYVCRCWGSFLVAFSFVSLLITLFGWLDWLQFIYFLSYVKLGVTLSKYFPQAILNYKRQSTVGWSISNILLDFSGGVMDICQMILQASNTDDWSAFYGNPVKFILGLVSIFFDIFFMVQHYILYRDPPEETAYNHFGTFDSTPNANSNNDIGNANNNVA